MDYADHGWKYLYRYCPQEKSQMRPIFDEYVKINEFGDGFRLRYEFIFVFLV